MTSNEGLLVNLCLLLQHHSHNIVPGQPTHAESQGQKRDPIGVVNHVMREVKHLHLMRTAGLTKSGMFAFDRSKNAKIALVCLSVPSTSLKVQLLFRWQQSPDVCVDV